MREMFGTVTINWYTTNKNFLIFSFKNYPVDLMKFVILITIWLGQQPFFNEKVRKFLSVTYQQITVARTEKTFLSVWQHELPSPLCSSAAHRLQLQP